MKFHRLRRKPHGEDSFCLRLVRYVFRRPLALGNLSPKCFRVRTPELNPLLVLLALGADTVYVPLPSRHEWVEREQPFFGQRGKEGVGAWMRPTSGLRASGCIYTGLLTPPVRRSISFSRLNATRQQLSAFSPTPWAERTIRRGESSTPTSTPVIHRLSCGSKPHSLPRSSVE
jgi:hypothetical protein